jgi:CTP-dependent riboflavin kinase
MVIVSLKRITDPSAAQFFNAIPTSFALTGEQVDALIAAGYNLLLERPQYQRLVRELNGRMPQPRSLNVKLPEQRNSSFDLLDL